MHVDWLDAVMLVEWIGVGDGRINECCLHVSIDESWIIEWMKFGWVDEWMEDIGWLDGVEYMNVGWMHAKNMY